MGKNKVVESMVRCKALVKRNSDLISRAGTNSRSRDGDDAERQVFDRFWKARSGGE